MSDRYWDVRSCRWQGGTVELVPEWRAARAQPSAPPEVPPQTTAEQVEVLPPQPVRQGTRAG